MPDLTDRLRDAKATADEETIRRIRRSHIVFGDHRVKVGWSWQGARSSQWRGRWNGVGDKHPRGASAGY